MERSDFNCPSLDDPEKWVLLKDLNHAFEYAKELLYGDDQFMNMLFQLKDFRKHYWKLLFEPHHERGLLDFINFEIILMDNCINEARWLMNESITPEMRADMDLDDEEYLGRKEADPWDIEFEPVSVRPPQD